MSNAMPSSIGETLLLLKKWRSDSNRVVILQAFICAPTGDSQFISGVFSRTTGLIADIEDATGTFTFRSADKDFVIISPTGCIYGYDANYKLPPQIAKLVPASWDSLIVIRFPNDAVLIIFAL